MRYVIATAGHVDHGKSTLVKAITGMDPDRLEEEQRRQMTIDLGFAWFTTQQGDEIGIVDVPGHRDFISNMLAGVGGIDAVILVVAADEGLMPQTIEHIHILDLLTRDKGIIAITKMDMVQDREWFTLVEQDIRDCITGTSLQAFPIVHVSATTGEGIQTLLETLQQVLSTIERQKSKSSPRMAIDRVFSVKGFGTVVTGTLLDGDLELGAEIQVLPSGKHGRIRGIQTHKSKLQKAETGSRVALNINGLEVSDINRGDVVVLPGTLLSTTRFDSEVRLIASARDGLKHNDHVKLFHGTAEIMARARTLGTEMIQPGESGFVQFELQEPIVLRKGDRFILRRPSPAQTIGGGYVINVASSRKYKRFTEKTLNNLSALSSGSPLAILSMLIEERTAVSTLDLQIALEKEGLEPSKALRELQMNDRVIQFPVLCPQKSETSYVTTGEKMEEVSALLYEELVAEHEKSALIPGLPASKTAKQIKVRECVLQAMLEQGLFGSGWSFRMGYVCHEKVKIAFNEKDDRKIKQLDAAIQQNPFAPPVMEEVSAITGSDLLQALIFKKKLVPVSGTILFREQELEQMKEALIHYLETNEAITLAQFRDLFHTSRKYALAFLDYMDEQGVTIRVDEVRTLRHSG